MTIWVKVSTVFWRTVYLLICCHWTVPFICVPYFGDMMSVFDKRLQTDPSSVSKLITLFPPSRQQCPQILAGLFTSSAKFRVKATETRQHLKKKRKDYCLQMRRGVFLRKWRRLTGRGRSHLRVRFAILLFREDSFVEKVVAEGVSETCLFC